MDKLLFPASARGKKDSGWLRSNFYFSFSDYCNPSVSSFGTLFAFNDDYLQPGKGFGTHPHQNMEIISVLLQGTMNHQDSMGYSTTIGPGGVQIMSAGEGLFHEEYNIGEDEVNFLQIWIQPKLQNVRPRYQQRTFPREQRVNQLVQVISHEEGLAHCWINQNAKLSLGYFDREEVLEYSFASTNKCLFIFCIEGEARIDDITLAQRDAVGIWNTSSVKITVKANAELLIIETVINQK
jgi:redox-sensitive bicupin YhaK (pirin superfamily)